MSTGSLLFFDPATGERLDYEALRASVSGERVEFAPLLKPKSPGEALRGLLRALLLGQELTLFDSDFSDEEVGTLGADSAALARRRSVPGLPAAPNAELAAEARAGANTFRLTLFTSGTTGRPRRVTHRLEGLTRSLRVGPTHATSVWGLAYNPTHIAGVQVVLQAFFNRNPLVNLFGMAPQAVARALVEHGVTHLSATPSFYRLLVPNGARFPGVRAATLGGERSDAALHDAVREMFPAARLRNLYASTEAGTLLEADGEDFFIPEKLRDRVRIRDGQLEVHVSLLGEREGGGAGEGGGAPGVEQEAWYRTGDLVEPRPGASGRFRVISRESDLINVGGHKVNAAEVETALSACPGVREARVFGRKNSVLGEVLCAEIVSDAEVDEAALRDFLAARLQPVKVPRLIKRVAALARTRSGKLSREPKESRPPGV